MIENNTKELVKGLFNELLDLDEEKTNIGKDIKSLLKKNKEYQDLLKEKKALDAKIKDKKESILGDLLNQNKNIFQNAKIIKEDISEKIESKIKIVNQIFKFFKMKFKDNNDELQETTDNYVELFEVEDNK